MNKISIVIPTYNADNLLFNNLPKIIKLFPGQEIIVIDDGSVDKTQSVLSKLKVKSEKLKVIKNKTNYGFSSAANKGMMAADSPLILLLNNDCVPERNFLNLIYPYFRNNDTFAVSCLEKFNHRQRGRGIGGFNKGLLFHQPGKLNKNNTLWAFGAATVYNRQLFEKLYGFDENFNPFYWEDFDLSYRAWKSGYKIYFEKKAVVLHQESSTIKKIYSQRQIEILSFRNQLFCCWKNITDRDFLVKHFFWLPYHLLWTTFKTKGAFLSGFLKALSKLKSIFQKRKENSFILSDKEILRPFSEELLYEY